MGDETQTATGLRAEIAAYERMRSDLEIEHLGEWVVVHGGKVIGTYDDFQEAAETAVDRFGRGPYLIMRIGEPPLTLPASLLYRPVHADR